MAFHENLLWLCDVASPTGQEGDLADELARRLSALPAAAPVRRYGNSLVAPLSRGSGGPKVLLVSQLDVVASGQTPPARLDGGRVVGPGVASVKSGLSLLLDLAERPPAARADITLVFHARGEGGFDGSELGMVLKRDAELSGADLALVLEPTDNKLQLGSGGSTHATLALKGSAAHSGLPGAGQNAIHKFARVLSRLATFEPVPDVVNGLTWYETMSATTVHGGRPGSVVPDRLEVNVHHVYGPSTDTHDSQDRLIALVDRVGAVRFEELSASAAPNREHPLLRSLEGSGVRDVEARQTWSEVARFATLGVAAGNFGPAAERLAHTRNESVDIQEIELSRSILERWFATMS